MSNCVVTFNNGKRHLFTGSATTIIKQVYQFCDNNKLDTVDANWYCMKEDGIHMVVKETDGKHNNETIYCPVNGTDCPYYEKGICYIANPVEECDDFGSFFESWEEWEEAE